MIFRSSSLERNESESQKREPKAEVTNKANDESLRKTLRANRKIMTLALIEEEIARNQRNHRKVARTEVFPKMRTMRIHVRK